jgi:hypothetical protein
MIPLTVITSGAFLSAMSASAGGAFHIQSFLTLIAMATGALVAGSYITTRILLLVHR